MRLLQKENNTLFQLNGKVSSIKQVVVKNAKKVITLIFQSIVFGLYCIEYFLFADTQFLHLIFIQQPTTDISLKVR